MWPIFPAISNVPDSLLSSITGRGISISLIRYGHTLLHGLEVELLNTSSLPEGFTAFVLRLSDLRDHR
jgi:hypothetical protein